jgi:hypothetical protein
MASGQGETTIDFGAFPGKSDASVTVTGATVAGIQTTSLVEAWISPKATADHSADEHLAETINVVARPDTIIAGTSFRIDGWNTSKLGDTLLYGLWTVGYCWSD